MWGKNPLQNLYFPLSFEGEGDKVLAKGKGKGGEVDPQRIRQLTKPEGMLTWRDLEVGSIVTEPGSASQYQTGDWRSQRPIFDSSKCNKKCILCYIFCPDGCIERNAEGYFEANLFYCKGCGICAIECRKRAITMVKEEE